MVFHDFYSNSDKAAWQRMVAKQRDLAPPLELEPPTAMPMVSSEATDAATRPVVAAAVPVGQNTTRDVEAVLSRTSSYEEAAEAMAQRPHAALF